MSTYLLNVPMSHPTFVASKWHDTRWQHRQVMALFGDLGEDARARGGILFRTEPDQVAHDDTPGRVLIQSRVMPTDLDGVRRTKLSPLLDRIVDGDRVLLLLRANTVRTINRVDAAGIERTHRARIPSTHLETWFEGRLAGAAKPDRPMRTTPGVARCGRAQLVMTTFQAPATVTDARRLAELARDGVGRAKSYGCGMLSILPLT